MTTQLRQLRFQLEKELDGIFMDNSNTLLSAKKSLVIIRDCCRTLSTLRLQCDFSTKEDEIYFFKELKCYYYSQLYYFQDIIEIECGMPNGSQESKQNFLKEYLHKLNHHYNLNRYLYIYYRTGATDKDQSYFSLIHKHDTKFDDQAKDMFCEDDYSCAYDLLYARVISNDKLEKFLHKEINFSEGIEKVYGNILTAKSRSKLEWTESKAALIELLYALHESKCINGGNVDIKELAELAKTLFPNIDVTDYYRTYIDLKNRGNRTKFIDLLKSSLTERLKKDDER